MQQNPQEAFIEAMQAYQTNEASLLLGAAKLDGVCYSDALVRIPLRTMNRHGLIAGATGTGKTKTVQLLAGGLSDAGVPVMLMDLKGDLSGVAKPGTSNTHIEERHAAIGVPFSPSGHPVELLTLSDEPGLRLRATVSEFGPVLFSQMLDLNDTQSGVMALVFKYCDDKQLPLVDLRDVAKTLQYLTTDGQEELERDYGRIATSSAGAIQRKLLELEQQGAERFFGEPSFEVSDLCRFDAQGRGVISILRLTDIQDRPKLFSTFMLSLLAEVYASFPESGDLDKPKLVIVIDEAHLVFDKASDALLDQLEGIVKLIRSKGVGIFFCTQNPADVPDAVLGQLGLKIQHALRAFTAKDRKNIRLAAENYPLSDFYKTDKVITDLGIGEALVCALDRKGRPTPLAATLLCAPDSRMDVLSEGEIKEIVGASSLCARYNASFDRDSAHEILGAKMKRAGESEEQERRQRQQQRYGDLERRPKAQKSVLEQAMGSTVARQMGRTFMRELTRGILGVLGLGGRRR